MTWTLPSLSEAELCLGCPTPEDELAQVVDFCVDAVRPREVLEELPAPFVGSQELLDLSLLEIQVKLDAAVVDLK